MSKHTPGPWIICERTRVQTSVIEHEHGEEVAFLSSEWAQCKVDEMNANSRLIAVAPELLQALRTVQDAIARWRDGEFDDASIEELKYLVVDPAIAKAAGGDS